MSVKEEPTVVDHLRPNSVAVPGRRGPNADASDRIPRSSDSHQWWGGVSEATKFAFWLICGVLSLRLLWTILSRFVVPAIIESAYRREGLPFLNDIISGQTTHPLEHYLASWQEISLRIFGMLLVVGLTPLPLIATGPDVQRYLERRFRNAWTLMPAVVNTTLSLLGLVLVFYLYYVYPVGYLYFIAEDQWAEYGTFVSWTMASCFLSWMLIKDRGVRKPVFVLLALGTFLVAMEEISWGQRIAGLASPEFFAIHNLQAEINLHNLILFGQKKYMAAGTIILLWSILLPIGTRKWGRLRKWCDKSGIPIVHIHIWPLFLLAIFYLFFSCPVFRFYRCNEPGELFLGIGIAILSLDVVLTMRRGTRVRAAPATVATATVLLTLGTLTAVLVRFYSSSELLTEQLNSSASDVFPRAGMYRQAEMVFDYIDRHPEFSTTETRFRHGVLLMQMGEHVKAKPILEIALAVDKGLQRGRPELAGPYLRAGQVLKVLGREEEARAEFRHALEKDRARLQRVTSEEAKANIRWSLGNTLLASGDSAAALEEVSKARALASDRVTQVQIDHWIRENFGQNVLVPK